MEQATMVNDQPISATFFNEGKWLTEFITPDNRDVQTLYQNITRGITDQTERITALWKWVASQVKYTRFVKGMMSISPGGYTSTQSDYWAPPGITARVRVGNCATKSFLLASLLRNELPAEKIHCVLGNLEQPRNKGGHAWIEIQPNGVNYIMESTKDNMRPMVPADSAGIYEPVVYFNDQEVSVIEGRTVLEPFTAVYVAWLKDYLDWAYIEGGGR
jgi:hypothetical protein